MAMTAFELVGLLTLNSQSFDKGLAAAKTSAGSFGSKVASGFATVAKVGTAALGAATAGVTAFAKSAVASGSEFDTAMGSVAATMGKSVDDMEEDVSEVDTAYGHFSGTLRDFAIFMGQNTTFSATQAAGALNYMALAGYDASESMQMLPSVLAMAAAGSMDLALASDMITDTQSALGLSFDRTSLMVDEFAKAASTGNTSVEQLGEAFLRVGGLARELNGGMVTLSDGTLAEVDGVQELEIAFTAMANAGIKGGEAGTHMRNMLLKLSSPTADGTKALEEMGVAVFDAEGRMNSLADIFSDLSTAMSSMTQSQKLSVISDLFNARDTASAEALLNAVNESWDYIGESILQARNEEEGYSAATEMSNTKLNNLTGDITLFKSALEAAYITVNDKLSPTLREFVQFGSTSIQKITKAFQKGGLDGAMSTLGEILADGLNMIIEKIPMFVDAGAKLLSALGQGLFDNLDVIIDAAIQIVGKLSEVLISAAPKLLDAVLRIIESLITTLSANFGNILATIINLAMAIASTLMEHAPIIINGLIDGLINNLPMLVSMAVNLVLAIAEGITNNLPLILDGALQIMQSLISALIENIPMLVEASLALVKGFVQFAIDNLPLIIEAGIQLVLALVNGLIDALPMLIAYMPEMITTMVLTLIENFPKIVEAGERIIKMLVEGIASLIINIVDVASDIIKKFVSGIVDNANKIKQAATDMWSNFKDTLMGKLADAKDWGHDLIQNFIDGLKEKWNKLKETVSGIAGSIKDFLGFSEPKKGPLSNFHTYAPDMMDLFMQGIDDKKNALLDTVSNAFDFQDAITGPQTKDGSAAIGGGRSGNSYVINVNQPVATPADMLREIRTEAQYGLMIGESLA